jgi:DNA-binding transcriptional MerR regulator
MNNPGQSGVGPALITGRHRSGAVARMLRMPVATLRVWERRYALTQAALSPSGQRLYSADDVRRLALLKQLTDLGHAIGSLAALDMAQLQAVAATHAQVLVSTQPAARPGEAALHAAPAWRLVVVGPALGARLLRPALLRQLGRPVELLGPYADVAQAGAALQGRAADALLLQAPQLQAGWLAALEAAAPALTGLPKLVLYGFAADVLVDELAAAGVALLRDPQPDAVLAQWLRGQASQAGAPANDPLAGLPAVPPPRRWDPASLADFASLSTTVACECPRHVAELLAQLSHFEDYSAQCTHRNAADADLHRFLGRVAGEARARFEAALEHVALHEGLLLPPSAA